MSNEFSYDKACLELADYFLADEPKLARDREELAQSIQDAIESWFFTKQHEENVFP